MRETAGITIRLASKAIGRGAGTLQRIETGEASQIRDDDLEALCGLYERDDMLVVLKGLAAQGRKPNWWHDYTDQIVPSLNVYFGLESAAEELTVYRPDMVSGLFQTPDYARSLDRLYFVNDSLEELEHRVRGRHERQKIITRRTAPVSVQLVIDEAVLRRMVGGPKVMAGQLRHLADLPVGVSVRVLPNARGFPLGTSTGPFTILDFGTDKQGEPNEPPVVFVENHTGDMYLEKPDSVRRYREAFAAIQRVALDVGDSKRLLRQVSKEYRS